MEAGSSRSGGMPQVRCSASASQNVPGVRYLQRPRSQGRQVCGSGQVNSYVSTQEGSAASLLFFSAGGRSRLLNARVAPVPSAKQVCPLLPSSRTFLHGKHRNDAFYKCFGAGSCLPSESAKPCQSAPVDSFGSFESMSQSLPDVSSILSHMARASEHNACISFFLALSPADAAAPMPADAASAKERQHEQRQHVIQRHDDTAVGLRHAKLIGQDLGDDGVVCLPERADEKGELVVIDASMTGGKVMKEPKPIVEYLRPKKGVIGVRFFRIKKRDY